MTRLWHPHRATQGVGCQRDDYQLQHLATQSGTRPYDVYNPEARDIYWKYLNKGIFSYIGNDDWWLDSTETDHINRQESDYDLPTHLGSYRSVKMSTH